MLNSMILFCSLSRFCGETGSAKLGSYYPPVFLSDKGDLTIYPTSLLLVAVDNYCFGVYVSGDSHLTLSGWDVLAFHTVWTVGYADRRLRDGTKQGHREASSVGS